MRVGTFALLSTACALTPFTCALATMAPEVEPSPATTSRGTFVDSGLKPPPDGKDRLDGGSLRPMDGSIVPDAAGLPDRIMPRMAPDRSLPDARPRPLVADDG